MNRFKAIGIGVLFPAVFAAMSHAQIYIEPYLQNPKTDGMTILWWTDTSEPSSQIEYGPGYADIAAASNEYVPSMGKWRHEATLGGLDAESSYDYRVRSGTLLSGAYTFKTVKKRNSDFRVGVLGDGQTDNTDIISRHRTVLNQAADLGADLIFEAGDLVQSGSTDHWGRLYREILTSSDSTSTVASRIPFHAAVGNHEIYDGAYPGGNLTTSMARYKALMSNPDNGSTNPDWKERYYSIKYGVATFIVLDLNNTSDDALDNHNYLNDGDTPDWEPGSEQYNWMTNELRKARDDGAFTFVMFHPAPFSRGVHGDPGDSQRGYELRTLDPVFRQYGVDAVLASHDHMVEHCLTGPAGFETEMDLTDPDNLNYITMGNSGDSSRTADSGWENWMDITGNNAAPFYTTYFYRWGGNNALASFIDMNFINLQNGTWRVDFEIVRSDGQTFDAFSLVRTDNGLSSRGTPLWWLESHGLGEADDGQDPDFDGVPTWMEWISDTDPTNNASALKITGVEPGAAGSKVHWKGGVQATQVLEWRTNLVSGTDWKAVFTNLPPTPETNDYTDPGSTGSAGFYRFKAHR